MAKELNVILTGDDNVEMADDGTNIKFRVKGSGWTSIVVLTQAEYDLLTPDPNTLYLIKADELAGFMFTAQEFAAWQDRWANGPYKTAGDVSTNSPGEVARITGRKDAFMSTGVPNWPPTTPPANGITWSNAETIANLPDRNGSLNMLCAAFYAAINSDTTVRDEWKATFDSFWQAPLLDFTNTTLYPALPNGNTDMIDEHTFEWAQHILRLLSGYDYLSHVWPDLWTQQDQDDIAAWFTAWGARDASNVHNNMNSRWSKRGDLAGATHNLTDAASGAAKLPDGNVITNLVINEVYNNRRGFAMFAGGIIGLRFGDTATVAKAETYLQEGLAIWMHEGVFSELHRGTASVPSLGLGYVVSTLGIASVFAEYHRRVTGSPILLDMEVALEVDKANPGEMKASTPKSLLTLMQEFGKHFDGTTELYRAAGAVTPSERIDGWHDTGDGDAENWKPISYVAFAAANAYYQDAYLDGLILQTGAGMPGYPSVPATDGGMEAPWGGPSQIMPSMPLQYMNP